MNVTALDHYNIRGPLSLMEKLCEFYRDALGLVVGPRPPFDVPGFWLYADDKPLVHLTVVEAGGHESSLPLAGHFAHIAFRCADLATARSRLDAMDLDYTTELVPSLHQVQLFFRDPAGIRIELNITEN